ncbi:MAG: S24 family peptidase [Pseudomonadota bacterium]
MLGFTLIRVVGDSMGRALPDGSFALFRKTKSVSSGDIVLARHHRFGEIVKRVELTTPETLTLAGDSPDSVSSSDIGTLPLSAVIGRLVWCSKPPA